MMRTRALVALALGGSALAALLAGNLVFSYAYGKMPAGALPRANNSELVLIANPPPPGPAPAPLGITQQIAVLQQRVDTDQNDIATLKSKVAVDEKDIGTLKMEVATLQSSLKAQQDQISTLQQGLQAQQAALQKLQTQFAAVPKPVYSYCKDPQTLASSSGQVWACSPYICQGTACLKQCSQVSDCVSPYVCNAGGVCVSPP